MTDLYVTKAIVKLPPKSRQSILLTNNNNNINNMIQKPMDKNKYQRHLVSERLYVEVPSTITENDIILLLQSCQPQNIELTPSSSSNLSTGYISFPNKDLADCALTLFNGATFKNKNNIPIQLYIHSNNNNDDDDLQPMADILQACDLPSSTTNQSLYDLFRPFGPLALCKIIMDLGTQFNGTAMIRYYHINDSDQAISSMNNKVIQGKTIDVFPFVSSKQQQNGNGIDTEPIMKTTTSTTTTTATTLINSPSLSKGDNNTIDYTNLYIKNLDLNVKSSDLFNHFRKYGRIISARVMKNTDTKVSKGFGFVSFSTSDEASEALKEMDGQYILNKPIQVAFHEPKKSTRNETTTTTTSSPPSNNYAKPSSYENNSSTPSNGSPLPIKQQQQQHHQASSPLINQYNNTPKLSTSNSTSIPNSSNITSKSSSFSPPLPQQPFYQQRQQQQQHMQNNHHHYNTNHNNNNHHHNNHHHNNHHQYNNNNNNIPSTQHQQQQDIFNSKQYQKKQPNLSRNKSSNQSLSDNIILQNGFTVEKNSRGYMDYHQQIKPNGRQIPTDNHSNHSYGISSPPLPSSLSSSLPSAYNHRSNNNNNTNNNTNNSNNNHFQPSLSTLASGATIQQSPYSSVNNNNNNNNQQQQQQQPKLSIKPTLRRRGSIESICSVATETSSHAQRQKMIKAVQENSNVPQHQLDDIVDMLLTLKKKERSLCLFNPDFLRSKIQQALDALTLTMDDDSNDDDSDNNENNQNEINHHHQANGKDYTLSLSSTTNYQQQQNKKLNTLSHMNSMSPSSSPNLQNQYSHHYHSSITSSSSPSNDNNDHNDINGIKRKSHAIPIVAPTTATTTTTTVTSPKSNNNNSISAIEIDTFLATIENLTTLEKKQKLGDKLFPLVKATGIKHAPKVTIRLLDNIALKDLAHIMNDQVKLQSKIDYVMSLP